MRRGLLFDRASTKVMPKGTRPPRVGAFRACVGLVWLLALGIDYVLPALVAEHGLNLPSLLLDVHDELAYYDMPPIAKWVALAGVGLLLAELALQLSLRAYQRRSILDQATHPQDRLVFRIQTPRIAPTPGTRLEREPSADLFRAVQGALPSRGQRLGHAPYAAFCLLGEPDSPAALQLVIAGGNEVQRKRMASELSAAIRGQVPHAVIEAVADPLLDTERAAVVWREFRLMLPSHYPLRLLDDVERSDILGPLLASLRVGQGVRCVEVQTIIQPIRGVAASFLHRGWRGQATALRIRLQQKAEYSLKDDASDIERKLEGVPYYTTLRVVVVAEHRSLAVNALHAVESALQTYACRTSHLVQRWRPGRLRDGLDPVVVARAPRVIPFPTILLPASLFRPADVLCGDELAGLWHLPTPRVQDLIRTLPSRYLPAPPEVFAQPRSREWLGFGDAQRGDGTLAAVGTTMQDMREIVHIVAGPGAGKTRQIAHIVQQALPYGCTVINGKDTDEGLTWVVQNLIARGSDAEKRLVLLNPLDSWWPIGLNLLHASDANAAGVRDQIGGQVLSLFDRLDDDGMSPPMQTLLDMATLLVLEGSTSSPTIAQIDRALNDVAYRAQLLPNVQNIKVRQFWEARRDGVSEQEQQSLKALERRFSLLLTKETLRALVVQSDPRFDFATAINARSIVLIDLPHSRLEGLAGVVGMLTFWMFVRAALGREGSAQTRRNYLLVVDELQEILASSDDQDFARAVSQLREYGFPAVYAHQAFAQLGKFRELMQVSAGTQLIMRTKNPDAKKLAGDYAGRGLSEVDISSLDPTRELYAVLRIAGQHT
jgi:hypothetical protein